MRKYSNGRRKDKTIGSAITNGLSFDVEEFFHAHNLARAAPPDRWDYFPSRVQRQLEIILGAHDEAGVKATFFFLAWVAERHAGIVKRVLSQGHEIATHGYGHQFVYRQSRAQFGEDLKKSVAILEDITGRRVLGYRAPSFSITNDCLWALDVIKEAGLRYDSSLFPVHLGNRGGVASRFVPHEIRSGLCEMPVASMPFMGVRLPLSGGFYFRFFPYSLTRWGIGRINRRGEPAVLYFHPWEFDSSQPALKGIPAFPKYRHYVNLKTNLVKLRALLKSFRWAPLREVLLDWEKGNSPESKIA